jgi:hypothetical protein
MLCRLGSSETILLMKFLPALLLAGVSVLAIQKNPTPTITGDYLEVRSCDVYTGPCFANAEMGLTGKECILAWSVKNGAWNGVNVDGLKVIAVVRANGTLGDQYYQPRTGKAVFIVDERSTPEQAMALQAMATSFSGKLIKEVASVKSAPIDMSHGTCSSGSCGKVYVPGLVEVSTRCFGDKDHVCGNEETFYPPISKVEHAIPAFTEVAAYTGNGLNMTWEAVGQRSAFLGHFSK